MHDQAVSVVDTPITILTLITSYCMIKDYIAQACTCKAVKGLRLSPAGQLRIPRVVIGSLGVDAVRGDSFLSHVDIQSLRVLDLHGAAVDLIHVLTYVVTMTGSASWRVEEVGIAEENHEDDIVDKVAFARTVSACVAALVRNTYLRCLRLNITSELGGDAVSSLSVSLGWSRSLKEVRLRLASAREIWLVAEHLISLGLGWAFAEEPGCLFRTVLHNFPPEFQELCSKVGQGAARVQEVIRQLLMSATSDEELANVSRLISNINSLFDALTCTSRGAADDDDDELRELDAELAWLIESQATVEGTLEAVQSLYGVLR
mmetsp:Transcript_65485/g.114592  ORF Transcript_65485/g.114592 Transcript_65485/m.114592 type:complete len:318 (+) Transcript_65485:146-1099(+)